MTRCSLNRSATKIAVFLVLLSSAASAFAGPRATRDLTALDRYVFREDPSYKHEIVDTLTGPGYSAYVVRLTSQTWRTSSEVNQPVWRHWLLIVQPERVSSTTGLLFISGGSNRSDPPKSVHPAFVGLALSTQSVVAELRQVPNEPLEFTDDGGRARTEDQIIAYTWDKFLRTNDETWPLRLPMTKSAVRAMDAVTAICAASPAKVKVEKFVVGGGSKRGWATWTTAAVDDRVVAIMPFVIDVLNMEQAMEHHYRAYGFWAPAIQDYIDAHIMDWIGTPQFKALMNIEDPFTYRARLTMPKYIVNSTGDQYFPPDSWQFYFGALSGEKYLRYVPNTKHDLDRVDTPFALAAFYESIVKGTPRPRFEWRFEDDGAIVVTAQDKPSEVKLWQATNPKARDFRLDTLGPAFHGSVLEPDSEGRYVGRVSKPESGWTAYFVEMVFPSGGQHPFKFSTGVRIIPDTLPGSLPKATATGR